MSDPERSKAASPSVSSAADSSPGIIQDSAREDWKSQRTRTTALFAGDRPVDFRSTLTTFQLQPRLDFYGLEPNSAMCCPSWPPPIHLFSEAGLDEGLVPHCSPRPLIRSSTASGSLRADSALRRWIPDAHSSAALDRFSLPDRVEYQGVSRKTTIDTKRYSSGRACRRPIAQRVHTGRVRHARSSGTGDPSPRTFLSPNHR